MLPIERSERVSQKQIITILVILTIITMLLTVKVGSIAVLALAGLLLCILMLPLLIDRYYFFIFLWLFIVPIFDTFQAVQIAGTNPVVFVITGLTVPFACFLIGRDLHAVIYRFPFVSYLLLFDLILFLNIFRPNTGKDALIEFLKFFIEIFIVFCVIKYTEKGQAKKLASHLGVFITLNSIIAILQRITGIGLRVIEGLPRIQGLVGHPNVLAFLNVLYLPFAFYQMIHAEDKRSRRNWLVSIGICLLALILTMCKSVIAAFVLQLVVLFLFLPRRIKLYIVIALITFVIILVAADFLIGNTLFEQFTNRLNNNDSWEWRLKVWGWLMADIDLKNIWIGHGMDAAQYYLKSVQPTEPFFVHNVYLQMLYDQGLTSLLFIAALGQPFFKFSLHLLRKNDSKKIISVLALLTLFPVFMNMAADNSVFLRTPMSFFWVFMVYFYLWNNQELQSEKCIEE